MATTRDKRMKTDSPVPGQLSEASTPTTKSTAIKLKRLSRNRTSLLAVKSSENEDAETVDMSEDTQSSTTSENPANIAKTPNTRTKRQVVKESKDEESNGDVVKDEEELETPKKKRGVTPIKAEVKKPEKKATGIALIRQKALMKRKGPVNSTLRTLGRRLKGKVDLKSLAKDEKLVKPTKKGVLMKNGRQGRRTGVGAGRKARVVEDKLIEEEPEEEEMEDEEEEEEELEEDDDDDVEEEESTEVEVEEAELDDKTEKESTVPDIVVKQEKLDAKNTSIAASADLSGVRRSTRARKSTNKDRDSSVTSKKKESQEIKKEKFDTKTEPIVIEAKGEKIISKAISITVEATEASEKDASLSPEMVSEELDTMSVQHLYDKPHFLENNLGIEQDPKLGDIVKVQEKTKISDKDVDVDMKDDSKEIKAKTSDDVIESEKMDEDDTEKESASESADESSTKSEEASKDVKEVEKQIVTKKVEEIVPKDKSPESKSDKVEIKIVAEPKDIANEEIKVEKVKESIKTVKKVKQPEVAKEAAAEKPKESVKVLKKSTKTADAEEPIKATIKVEKVEDESSKEESGEENKENNDASGKSSVGSNSPRSEEDCLKSVGEDNIVKEINNEDIELLRLKELHFKTLGLLTHKAADAATLATQKRNEEYIKNNIGNSTTSTSYGRKSKNSSSDQGYTGTLKTVIKLHRPREEKRKTRMPLKMTFQKKSRADRDSNGSANSAENSFYTIHNDVSLIIQQINKDNFLIHFYCL